MAQADTGADFWTTDYESLFSLTLTGAHALCGAMASALTFNRPTSGQLGTAAEIMVACQLMLASGGRLSSYVPLVDDDGIDVMVHDKLTHQSLGLQIKSWTFLSEARPQTVQYDVGRTTWRDDARLFLLCVAIDGHTAQLEVAWLIASREVPAVSNLRAKKMSLTPNPRANSKDRYAPYRQNDMAAVADALTAVFDA
ncbi:MULTISPECIES: hypothetical protein [Hyphobacterium]|uniref:PD(D/E)XK endonuclease domain-containing protein n=1 Tax=Hyphobacterium vulgare TaxID=1736751 RepID=A0ABV6ZVS2_9PROT